MKKKSAWVATLVVCTAVLLLVAVYFYFQTTHYRSGYKDLVLENDSLAGVNLELKDSLKKSKKIIVTVKQIEK